jgi:transposase
MPIDNNACERILRGIAVGRRNWLFVGSESGGQAASVFFSMLCSASLDKVEPYASLKDVLDRLARIRNERLLRANPC